jgi:tetratricopeptide (TPR) repeat protein
MIAVWAMAAFFAAAPALETARDTEDRAALEKLAGEAESAAAKAPNDAAAQYRAAVAASYLAEVALELRDRKLAQEAAERGIKAAERAVALKPDAENYRVLGTLCGQVVPANVLTGIGYGKRARDAINKALEKDPRSAPAYVARGVGNYYLPPAFGGGMDLAIADFRKAIELDPKSAEAYLWLGLSLRKENKNSEARQAFARSLELNPNRVWTKQQLEKTPPK